jgi:hypothetical protein
LENYFITNNENNIEEDVHILKLYKTLHQLLVDAQYPNCILSNIQDIISVSQIKLFVPYHFDHSKFPTWPNQPGQPTIRVSNGVFKDNCVYINLAFNNWKYIQLAKRESNKKRKLEVEALPESIPTEIVESQKVEVMEPEN